MSVRKIISGIDIAAVVCYVLAFFVITFPLIGNFGRVFLGGSGGYRDLPLEIWLHWFISSSIQSGASFGYTDLVHYPVGYSLLENVSGFLIPAFTAVPRAFFGLPASYNFSVCFFTVFGAFAGYLLVRFLCKDRAAAFFGGFLFGFNPFVLNEMFYGRLPASFGGWIALFVLALCLMAAYPERTFILRVSALWILAAMTSLYYGVFLVFFAGIFIIFQGFQSRPFRWPIRLMRHLGIACLICLVFVIIFYRSHLFGMRERALPARTFLSLTGAEHTSKLEVVSRQSVSLAWPYTDTSVFPDAIRRFSLVMIGFSLVPVLVMFKKVRFWFFSLLIFYVLALGPFLKISGKEVLVNGGPVPLPFLWICRVFPFFARVHWPDRFLMFCMLAFSALSGFGFAWLSGRVRIGRVAKGILATVCVCLFMLETALVPLVRIFPASLTPAGVPRFYEELSSRKNDCAIIQFPRRDTRYLYYQTVHGKKMLEGQYDLISFFPRPYLDFVEGNGLLRALWRLEDSGEFPVSDIRDEDFVRLKEKGFVYIVVNTREAGSPALAEFLSGRLGVYKKYEDGIIVFKL